MSIHPKNIFMISGFWILLVSILLVPMFINWIVPIGFYIVTIGISASGFMLTSWNNKFKTVLFIL